MTVSNNESFRILFICTGNVCRSPIGEVLLRKRLNDAGLSADVEVASAGTDGWDHLEAAPQSISEVEKRGTSLDDFASRPLTAEICEWAHLILVMEYEHLDFIAYHYPSSIDKTRMLGQFLEESKAAEIPDPIGQSDSVYARVASLIDSTVQRLVREWDAIRRRYYDPKQRIIAIGVDHRGFSIKTQLTDSLREQGIEVIDCGTDSNKTCDHPFIAFKVGELVLSGIADRGVLVCGSGHGMVLAANRVPRVRAILPVNADHAAISRIHNQSNVFVSGSDFFPFERIDEMLRAWLDAEFMGGKYQRRVRQVIDYRMKDCK